MNSKQIYDEVSKGINESSSVAMSFIKIKESLQRLFKSLKQTRYQPLVSEEVKNIYEHF